MRSKISRMRNSSNSREHSNIASRKESINKLNSSMKKDLGVTSPRE